MKVLYQALILFLILLSPVISSGQITKSYFNGNTKIIVDTANQMLNGNFVFLYENGNLKAKGKIKNNQKTGKWKFYSENGKLLLTRNYKNNFIFHSNEKLTGLKLNNKNYWKTNDYNISYVDVFSTLIKNTDINREFFQNNLLFSELKNYLEFSENKEVYNNDDFSEKLTNSELDIISKQIENVNYFVFKEIAYYDLKYQIINRRILAIIPVEIKGHKITPIFSVWAEDFRKFSNNQKILDKLFYNQYLGELIKIYFIS